MMINGTPEEIAAWRFQIIAPLLTESHDRSTAIDLRRKAAASAGVDERTVRRWIQAYTDEGFEGLKPKYSQGGREKAIPLALLDQAIELRKELPGRSVSDIIMILEGEGLAEPGAIKRSTLQRAFEKRGFSSAQMHVYQPQENNVVSRRFERKHRNESWQSDIKYGPFIAGKRTYLISFLDDRSRYTVHSEFYPSQKEECVLSCMRSAFVDYGVPDRVHIDNGQVYRGHHFGTVAAQLGIRVIYCQPYSPESKGKIERFHRTVGKFLKEFKLEKNPSLDDLNHFYSAWLKDCYETAPHKGLEGRSPWEVFDTDSRKLRYVSEEELTYAFLRRETRTIDKEGCISFEGRPYKVDNGEVMMHRKVEVVYDPNDTSELIIEVDNVRAGMARPRVITPHAAPKPRLEPPQTDPGYSRLLRVVAPEVATEPAEPVEPERPRPVIRFSQFGGDKDNV